MPHKRRILLCPPEGFQAGVLVRDAACWTTYSWQFQSSKDEGACGGYVLDGLDMDWTISLLTLTLTPALLSRGYILDFAR